MQIAKKLKNHLDIANSRYAQMTNINELLSLKYNDLDLRNLVAQKVNRILTIGIGSGIELIALSRIYKLNKTKIFFVDFSTASIALAKRMMANHNLDHEQIKLIKGSAVSLPFPDGYFDIIFMNSLLHEVFSYSPNGNKAWKLAIQEASRVLIPNGVLYIEDFTAADEIGKVRVVFKSEFAIKYYNYFRKEYRSFNSWGKAYSKLFSKDRKLIIENMPVIKRLDKEVILESPLALELLTHFKVFNNDLKSGITFLGDKRWIEINERYYPSPEGTQRLLSTDQYVKKVLNIVNKNGQVKEKLKCLKFYEITRPNFTAEISKHFSAKTKTGTDFIQFSSRKMKMVFKKVN